MYKVCVPSYKRPHILKQKTMKLLERLQNNLSEVDVIVETDEMAEEYRKHIGDEVNIIVSNTDGIKEKRNFVRDYYQNKTDVDYLICLDDDIDELLDYDKPITREAFIDMVEKGFTMCEEKGFKLWGVSAFNNSYYLERNISTNLRYICGAFWGLIIDRDLPVLQTQFNHYEDFCFTCQHYLRDKGVLRFNWIALKTKYFNPDGGISDWYGGNENRRVAQKNDAKVFTELYPKMARVIEKKSGFDLRLNHRYGNKIAVC